MTRVSGARQYTERREGGQSNGTSLNRLLARLYSPPRNVDFEGSLKAASLTIPLADEAQDEICRSDDYRGGLERPTIRVKRKGREQLCGSKVSRCSMSKDATPAIRSDAGFQRGLTDPAGNANETLPPAETVSRLANTTSHLTSSRNGKLSTRSGKGVDFWVARRGEVTWSRRRGAGSKDFPPDEVDTDERDRGFSRRWRNCAW